MGVAKKTAKKTTRKVRLPGLLAGKDVLVIKSERQFDEVTKKVELLMNKGSLHLSEQEFSEIRRLSLAAREYENKKYIIDPPGTLEGIIEWVMYRQRLKQKDMAKELGMSDTKLSLVMNGRQKPDISLLKSLHDKYGVNAETLLSVV